jgi:hypothetical protein
MNLKPKRKYIAFSPGHGALFGVSTDGSGIGLIGLAFNAQVHDMITANSAVVDLDIP